MPLRAVWDKKIDLDDFPVAIWFSAEIIVLFTMNALHDMRINVNNGSEIISRICSHPYNPKSYKYLYHSVGLLTLFVVKQTKSGE